MSPAVVVPAAVADLPPFDTWSTYVLAVGKAAGGMFDACTRGLPRQPAGALAIGPERPLGWDDRVPFVAAGHPYATPESARAARLALELAATVPEEGTLLCLLSGGASALMAAPMTGLTLEAKQRAVRHVMTGGADIGALNALRKHLSTVKGGRLAVACRGAVVTLAISDVIGDDLSVIGSGPCVPDQSTWDDAASAAETFGGWDGLDASVRDVLEAGRRGKLADTPKAGDPRLARAVARVIAGRRQGMAGAEQAARRLGYDVVVLDEAVAGEARHAGPRWWEAVRAHVGDTTGRRVAVVSSGETTVRVTGHGRGGRNQEFALALTDLVASRRDATVVVSIGTDGVDGPTDAAGAVVDSTTAARAATLDRSPARHLADNDSYPFFDALGDLIRTGATGTNVGDLQVLLVGPA